MDSLFFLNKRKLTIMASEVKLRIKTRRDTAANWTSENPLLLDGEQGYEKDTGKLKFGNGTDNWNDLEYFRDGGSVRTVDVATVNTQPEIFTRKPPNADDIAQISNQQDVNFVVAAWLDELEIYKISKDLTLLPALPPIAVEGYFPLYRLESEAINDPNGNGTTHAHQLGGVTYYMPNGLGDGQYHGNYSQ